MHATSSVDASLMGHRALVILAAIGIAVVYLLALAWGLIVALAKWVCSFGEVFRKVFVQDFWFDGRDWQFARQVLADRWNGTRSKDSPRVSS